MSVCEVVWGLHVCLCEHVGREFVCACVCTCVVGNIVQVGGQVCGVHLRVSMFM